MSIAEKIKNVMMDNGLNQVKICNDNSKCIVVQGKLNSDYIVTFKSNNSEDNLEYYTVLKSNINKRTDTIWHNTTVESFPLIIHIAKLYASNNLPNAVTSNSNEIKKPHYQRFMPLTLTVGIIIFSVVGVYLGIQIRNLCSKNENIELIR
jgi:hypothetical protein